MLADAAAAAARCRPARIEQRALGRRHEDRPVGPFIVGHQRLEHGFDGEGRIPVGIVVAAVDALVDLWRSACKIELDLITLDGEFEGDGERLFRSLNR